MKRFLLIFGLLSLVSVLVACGEREYVPHTFDKSFCDTLGDDKFVQVTGILKAPDTVIDEGDRMLVLMVTDINESQPWISVRIDKGKGNNEIAPLPDQFTLNDFKVKTGDGQTLTHGDPITIYGQMLGCRDMIADKVE